MQLFAAFTDFFRSRNWPMNLLLGSVCVLIPIVGMIVLIGWGVQCFIARHEKRDYPDIDFNLFVRYLVWGLWPFLVSLIGAVAIMVFLIPSGALMLIIPVAQLDAAAAVGVVLLAMAIGVIAMFVVNILLIPSIIRSGLQQDFAPAFHLPFILEFFKKVGAELVLASLFLLFVYYCLVMVGGTLCFFVGFYPATVVWVFASYHIYQQLYSRYLERGGTPIPVSSDLALYPTASSAPPALGGS
jgi:hypothetical protein